MALVRQVQPSPPEDGAQVRQDAGIDGVRYARVESNLDREVDWARPLLKSMALFCLGAFGAATGYLLIDRWGLLLNGVVIALVWAFLLGQSQRSLKWAAWRSGECALVLLGFLIGVWRVLA